MIQLLISIIIQSKYGCTDVCKFCSAILCQIRVIKNIACKISPNEVTLSQHLKNQLSTERQIEYGMR